MLADLSSSHSDYRAALQASSPPPRLQPAIVTDPSERVGIQLHHELSSEAYSRVGKGIFGNFLYRSSIGFKKLLIEYSGGGECAGGRGMAVMEIMKISEDCYENEC